MQGWRCQVIMYLTIFTGLYPGMLSENFKA